MLTIKQISNKKINAVQLYKCHSTQQLETYFNKKCLSRDWDHRCNHRCHNCNVYNFSLCISLPLVWTDIVYFIGSFCSWNCCKEYAIKSSPFVFRKCLSLLGYFKTILRDCHTCKEIQSELIKRDIKFAIDYDYDYKSFIDYYQTFTHSNNLYSNSDIHLVEPVVYRQKVKKSTLLSLIQN